MKKFLRISVLMLILLMFDMTGVNADLQQNEALTQHFLHEYVMPMHVDAVASFLDESFPVGTFVNVRDVGEYKMILTEEGTFQWLFDDEVNAEGTYSIAGDRLIWETDSYCADVVDDVVAEYVWTFEDNILTLNEVEFDRCVDRRTVLNGIPYTFISEPFHVGTFINMQDDDELKMVFTDEGTYQWLLNDEVNTEGTFSIAGDRLIWETDSYCGDVLVDYTWTFNDGILTLNEVEFDRCMDRRTVLNGMPYTLTTDPIPVGTFVSVYNDDNRTFILTEAGTYQWLLNGEIMAEGTYTTEGDVFKWLTDNYCDDVLPDYTWTFDNGVLMLEEAEFDACLTRRRYMNGIPYTLTADPVPVGTFVNVRGEDERMLILTDEGTYQWLLNGQLWAEGTYATEGDLFIWVTDEYCEGVLTDYTWTFEDGALTLSETEFDFCEGRRAYMNGIPYSFVE